jgi:Malectin domain
MKKNLLLSALFIVLPAAMLLSGCQTKQAAATTTPAATASASTPVAASPTTAAPLNSGPPTLVLADGAYRVKAGADKPFTDAEGRVWQADAGFDGGDVIERDADTKIQTSKDPQMYMAEHYGMDSFSCKVPNGKYTANLYFCETYDGINGPGQRVFSFSVMGQQFKDFDVWVRAGGPYKPYVLTVPVEVIDGVFRINFTTQIENPQINAIELIPAS